MEVDNPQRIVFAFFGASGRAKETRVSRGKARLDLARKMNERSRLVETRKTETKTQKISEELGNDRSPINEDIKKLESVVEEGTDSYIHLR